jgi:cell division transport system ATP-binding protein
MIRFDKVCMQYSADRVVLKDISFSVQRHEMVFITGRSGAGKSTLLKLLAVMERPTSGQIFVNEQPVHNLGAAAIPYYRRQIGVVFQDHQLLTDRTVFDNVALPLVITGCDDSDIGRRVRAVLDKVGLLKFEKCLPHQLSGGQQQRVGIARAMVNRPAILLADEPTGNLDPQLSIETLGLFKKFADLGTCVLIATHDLALIQYFNTRVLELNEGRMITMQADEWQEVEVQPEDLEPTLSSELQSAQHELAGQYA